MALYVLSLPMSAQAQDGQAYLSGGVGVYDILDDDEAVDFRLEYRSGRQYLQYIKPWAGVEFTTDGSVWGGAGLLADIPLTDRFYLIPSFGVGLYTKGSSDKDLDYPIQFRSQIEAGYTFENQNRLGMAFGHLSNASLGDDNPGTEVLNLYWHVPY